MYVHVQKIHDRFANINIDMLLCHFFIAILHSMYNVNSLKKFVIEVRSDRKICLKKLLLQPWTEIIMEQ